MAKRDPQTHPAASFGEELTRARITAGFSSQDALAARLGFERTVIAKAETGERPPTVEVLTAWCQACDLPLDLFLRFGEIARRAVGPVPSWFEGYLEAEDKAHTLRLWAPLVLPGLVQSADYARVLFLAMGMDEEAAEEQVAVRLSRQEILSRPDPPQLIIVLYEAVLDHLVGSPQIMHEALIHVVEVSKGPSICIQVIPMDTAGNAGLSGTFNLVSGEGTPDVLLMDGVEDVTSESRSLVRKAANIFVRVQADALPRAASRAVILEKAEQWKTR